VLTTRCLCTHLSAMPTMDERHAGHTVRGVQNSAGVQALKRRIVTESKTFCLTSGLSSTCSLRCIQRSHGQNGLRAHSRRHRLWYAVQFQQPVARRTRYCTLLASRRSLTVISSSPHHLIVVLVSQDVIAKPMLEGNTWLKTAHCLCCLVRVAWVNCAE
jgi:hypothetical protein